jgi:hypothetical protein
MVFNRKEFIASLKRHRVGLVVGAIVGFAAALYASSQGATLTTIAASGGGLLDSALGRNASLDVAVYKLHAVLISLGATIGFFMDMLLFSRGPKVRGRAKPKKKRYLY